MFVNTQMKTAVVTIIRSGRRKLSLIAVAGVIGWSVSAMAADRVYYRYANDEGVKVLNAVMPPEYAKNGYEIVTITGTVLEVISPALTEEQKAEAAVRRKREAELADWDESLLRRYSSVEDIEAGKLRKVHDFDASLSILRGNANNITTQIQQAQARAADTERAGRTVPQALLNQITSMQNKLEDTEEQMERREEEKQKIAEQYDLDAERFREIKPQKNTTSSLPQATNP